AIACQLGHNPGAALALQLGEAHSMRRTYRVWYGVLVLLALAPVGLRALSWRASRDQPVDPLMAEAGKGLFKHEWKPQDPLSPGGDGLGPVFNEKSCVACHGQGGLGG